MKPFLAGIGIALLIAAAAAAQTPKYGVVVNAEKNVNFAKFTSYSWTTGRPSFDKTIDSRVTAAVDHELSALGLTKAASGSGDVLVSYTSTTRTDVNVKGKPSDAGARPEQTIGTLVVALIEPASRKQVLQLR